MGVICTIYRQRKRLIVEEKIWIPTPPIFTFFFPNVKFWQVIYHKFEAKCIFSPIFIFFFPNVKFWQVIYYKFEAKCIFSTKFRVKVTNLHIFLTTFTF
jgi:hypothetical protein